MSKQIPFIGREDELAQIDKWVKNDCRIICINGHSGVGKTRFLQEIRQRLAVKEAFILTDIIDFDNPIFDIPQNMGRTIAHMLAEEGESFSSYQQALADLRRLEMAGINQQRLAQEELTIQRSFANAFNRVSSQGQVVLFLDTTNNLRGKTEIWHYVAEVFPRLKNCLLFIAGGDGREVGDFLSWQTRDKNVQIIDLNPWTSETTALYLQQKQATVTPLESTLVQKIIPLVQGRPALIDLVIEWASRDIPLTWLTESCLDSPDKKIQLLKFTAHLLRPLADMNPPLNRLIMTMTHLYPLDEELIAKLFKVLSSSEIQTLLAEAKTFCFVKTLPDGSITLPGKIRRLVKEYIWQTADPHGDYRVSVSEIATEHYEESIKKIGEQIKKLRNDEPDSPKVVDLDEQQDLLTKQWIIQACYANLDKGFSIYKTTVEKARNAKRWGFAKQLERDIQPYVPRLNSSQSYQFRLLYGKLLNDMGNAEEAAKLLNELLSENQGNLEREADIYNALSVSNVEMGKLPEALAHQLKCLDMITKLNLTQHIPPVSNYLGYIYRLNGRWAESIRYYQQALDLALQTNARPGMVASTMNNLGYVLGMDGQYEDALSYCQQALEIWRSQNNEFFIGQGESVLGTIYRNKEDYTQAEIYLNRAIFCFQKFEATANLVEAYLDLGRVYLMKGSDPFNPNDLEIACHYFERSLSLAMSNHHHKITPKIVLQYSYAHWELGQKDKAQLFNERAYWMAQECHDMHTVVHSIVALAEYDYEEGRYDNIPAYAQDLKDDYESNGYYFPLLAGRMRRILAEVAFQRQDYETAFNYYAEGLPLIAQHGGYGKYSLQRELEKLNQKLALLPPHQTIKWSKLSNRK